jgi:hypothetical protein
MLLTSYWPDYRRHLDVILAVLRIHPSASASFCAPSTRLYTFLACSLIPLLLRFASGCPGSRTNSLLDEQHFSHGPIPSLCVPPLSPPQRLSVPAPKPASRVVLVTLLLSWTVWMLHMPLLPWVIPLSPHGCCLGPRFLRLSPGALHVWCFGPGQR